MDPNLGSMSPTPFRYPVEGGGGGRGGEELSLVIKVNDLCKKFACVPTYAHNKSK